MNTPFDLILLDMSRPGLGGDNPTRGVVQRWPGAPVILLSSETAVEERIRRLNDGADHFLIKPFAVAELVARAHVVLRRRSRPAPDVFTLEDLQVNRVSHQVCRREEASK